MSAVVSLKVEDFFRFVVVVDSDRSNASHRSDSQRLNVIGSLKFRIAELPIVGPATLIERERFADPSRSSALPSNIGSQSWVLRLATIATGLD